jgi:hypothetical protein
MIAGASAAIHMDQAEPGRTRTAARTAWLYDRKRGANQADREAVSEYLLLSQTFDLKQTCRRGAEFVSLR